MNNTHLRLNVCYKVIPNDRGYFFDGPTKTMDPLIPDEVIMSLFAMRSSSESDYSSFANEYAQYRSLGDCFIGIPCPDIEGYSFNLTFKEGKIDSFKVCSHEQ